MTPRPPIESTYSPATPAQTPLISDQSASSTHFSPLLHGTLTTCLRDTVRRS